MAGSRSALIVATYLHDDPGLTRLQAPARDAEALAEILSDDDVGGFDVSTVVNGRWSEVNLAVAQFFHDRRPDDLLLLHFSCHGLKDDSGELYFAATDTRLDLLEATGVPSSFVSRTMDRSRAGRVLLLLDCCYAGAFARTGAHRGAGAVDVGDRLGGRGRVVITAASALQYAFEGKELTETDAAQPEPSVFTGALVSGLRTGEADRDCDGWVSLDELYAYVYDEVRLRNPNQTPKKWAFDIEGDVFIARRAGPVTEPSELPAPVRESMDSLLTWEREAVVQPLRELLKGQHPGRALGARLALERLATGDDSARVRSAAAAALAEVPAEAPAPPVPDAPEPVAPEPATPEPATPEPATPEPETPEPAEPVTPEPVTPEPVTPEPQPPGRRRWLVPVAAAVVLALVVGAAWAWSQRSTGGAGGGSTGGAGSEAGAVPAGTLPVSQLVMGGANGLTVYDAGSGAVAATVPGTRGGFMPAISPDRHWIAYLTPDESTRAGTTVLAQLRLVHPDGSGNRLLSDDPSCPYTTRAAWSPDGTRLAFVCLVNRPGSKSEGLHVYDVARATLRLVLPAQSEGMPSGTTVFGPPTWSSDSQVVFNAQDAQHARSLWQMPATRRGTPQAWVTPDPGSSDEFPAWSADGLLFVRCRMPDHAGCRIMLRSSDGTGTPLVTPTDSQEALGAATWGPGRGQLVWTRQRQGRTELQQGVLGADGTVTVDPSWHPEVAGADGLPAWGTPRPAQ